MINPYDGELRKEKKLVAEKLVGKEFESVLEVGCYWGESLVAIKDKFPNKRLVGVDVYKPIVLEAKKITGLDIRVGNVFDLQFEDKEFDVVYTNALFCMLEPSQVVEGLKEILRVARKYIILIELDRVVDDYLVYKVNNQEEDRGTTRTRANWMKLFQLLGLNATKEKISVEQWGARPWYEYGYIYEVIV